MEQPKAQLIANCQLIGDYGRVTAGQQFEADEATAQSLEERGLAYRANTKLDLKAAPKRRFR